jgi:CelD/BcsL family acetyltransferase involved in cellulose biosynthesis
MHRSDYRRMGLRRVMTLEQLSPETWSAFDEAHKAPTFFARPAWATALAQTVPALQAAALRVHVDGEPYVLPTVHAAGRRIPFREYLAFPLGGYTCVLDEHARVASSSATEAVMASVAQQVDRLNVIPWPLAPASAPAQSAARVHETAVIDCSDGFDAVMKRMRGVTRRMSEQALRRGVVCARASARELPVYYEMLKETSARWPSGRPTISYALFARVLQYGGDDAQLWFARVDGRAIAGGIVLFGAQELFFWSAAMDRNAAHYRPSNALNVALLGAACARGVRWYNLGASEGLRGVERFKTDLGAESILYREYDLRRPAFAWYERARRFVLAGNTC